MLSLRKSLKYILKELNTIKGEFRYSTEETFTGHYWIDGKPIYRKIYTHTSTLGETFTIDTDIYNKFDVDQMIALHPVVTGRTAAGTRIYTMEGDYFNTTADKIDTYIAPNGTIYYRNGSSYPYAGEVFILLEYTKLSDTPITGGGLKLIYSLIKEKLGSAAEYVEKYIGGGLCLI